MVDSLTPVGPTLSTILQLYSIFTINSDLLKILVLLLSVAI